MIDERPTDSTSNEILNLERGMRWRLLRAVPAGALLALGFPPFGLPLVLPLGVLLLLASLDRATVRQGLYAGFACGCIYFGATLFWLTNLFGAAAISLIAIAASFIALFGGVFASLRMRIPRIPVWFLAPSLWVGIEFYRSELFILNCGWMGLGYAVINSPWLATLAPWAGSYGITFLIVLTGALMLNSRFRIPAVCGWTLLVFLPGPQVNPQNSIKVRLVQAFSEDQDSLFGQSGPGVDDPDIILWPEYSLNSDPRSDPKLWQRLQSVARDNKCYFIFGAKDEGRTPVMGGMGGYDGEFRNTAFVLEPGGAVVGTHVKNHTVHFIKDGIRGYEAAPVRTTMGLLGVAICFDMDYPDVARRLAESGTQVFLVPNMDPGEWGPVQREQHRLMFQMRAAECGKWLARADVAGGTSVASPNGQELSRVNTTEATMLSAAIGRNQTVTPYVRWGWMLPRFCLGCMVVLIILGFRRSRVT